MSWIFFCNVIFITLYISILSNLSIPSCFVFHMVCSCKASFDLPFFGVCSIIYFLYFLCFLTILSSSVSQFQVGMMGQCLLNAFLFFFLLSGVEVQSWNQALWAGGRTCLVVSVCVCVLVCQCFARDTAEFIVAILHEDDNTYAVNIWYITFVWWKGYDSSSGNWLFCFCNGKWMEGRGGAEKKVIFGNIILQADSKCIKM